MTRAPCVTSLWPLYGGTVVPPGRRRWARPGSRMSARSVLVGRRPRRVVVSQFLGVCLGRGRAAVVVVHHFVGRGREVVFGERVLGLFVVDEGDDVGQLLVACIS